MVPQKYFGHKDCTIRVECGGISVRLSACLVVNGLIVEPCFLCFRKRLSFHTVDGFIQSSLDAVDEETKAKEGIYITDECCFNLGQF